MENFKSLLEAARKEIERLRAENARLRKKLKLPPENQPSQKLANEHDTRMPALFQETLPLMNQDVQENQPVGVTNNSPPQEKIALFRSLFKGREDVYPRRWQSKNGKSGYSPACAIEWDPVLCNKPKAKCTNCKYLPVTDRVIHDHLAGRHTIGVYPLLKDETCRFLAVDFDKVSWQEDVSAFLETCKSTNVLAVLERSRSGNGGHVWMFFEVPVPASQARKMGSALLTMAMQQRHQLGLDSYDRLFPNQDTMPKGGFGNLVALPLQQKPREQGNSVFIDENFVPYPDQWAFLAAIKKMQPQEVDRIVREAVSTGRIIDVRMSSTDADEDPWTLPPSGKHVEQPIIEPLPAKIEIVQSNLIFIEKSVLPAAMLNRLIRLAAFQNPEFYKFQAMRLSTFGKPRIISCAEHFPRHIGLPRGCLDEVVSLLEQHNVEVEITDERLEALAVEVEFQGELREMQQEAANALLEHDIGILSAATAFGKTVVAAWMIAARKTSMLVVVHRRQLLDQWRERLAAFLNISRDEIGLIGGGKSTRTGTIDIALIQSLNRKGEVKDFVVDYGHVIVDECHHIAAFRFEQVMKQVRAKYILGLTATPIRKDGHHPIILMQCGPIRYRVRPKEQAALRQFVHQVAPRYTDFEIEKTEKELTIQEIYSALIADEKRNDLIFDDLLNALENGHSPLLLTERTEHLDYFANRLKGFAKNVIVLRGG
jgi:hypothetical protein